MSHSLLLEKDLPQRIATAGRSRRPEPEFHSLSLGSNISQLLETLRMLEVYLQVHEQRRNVHPLWPYPCYTSLSDNERGRLIPARSNSVSGFHLRCDRLLHYLPFPKKLWRRLPQH